MIWDYVGIRLSWIMTFVVISWVFKCRKRNQNRESKRYDNGAESERCNVVGFKDGKKEAMSQENESPLEKGEVQEVDATQSLWEGMMVWSTLM